MAIGDRDSLVDFCSAVQRLQKAYPQHWQYIVNQLANGKSAGQILQMDASGHFQQKSEAEINGIVDRVIGERFGMRESEVRARRKSQSNN